MLLAWKVLDLPTGVLERMTDRTLLTRQALDADLVRARGCGFAVTHDELEVGLSGVAAPVQGADATVVAAVGVSGPTARLEDRFDHVGRLLMDQTAELSALLRHGTTRSGTPAGSHTGDPGRGTA